MLKNNNIISDIQCITKCIIYLEDNKPPEGADLNKGPLVLKDSNNHIIFLKNSKINLQDGY